MDAVDALTEIAFWLERELAPSFKVQAFRRAAATIAPLSAEELADRVADGRLKRTKGIGDRTFQVISQAVAGEVPTYLADLREKNAGALATGGEELLAALRGDLHSHTEWSDGTTPIEQMAVTASRLGREYLAVTDHSPTLTVASGLTAARLAEQLDTIAALDADATGGVTLLRGIEVDILENGTLDQTPEMLDRLDVVVASVHSKLRSDRRTMTERMLGGIRDPHTNVLGHCTGRLVDRARAERGRRPNSTRRRCSRRAPRTASRWRSTHGRSGRTRRTTSSGSPSTRDACSASTATRTPPGSSTSSATGRRGPRRTASRPSGSSRPGRSSGCAGGSRRRSSGRQPQAPGGACTTCTGVVLQRVP